MTTKYKINVNLSRRSYIIIHHIINLQIMTYSKQRQSISFKFPVIVLMLS